MTMPFMDVRGYCPERDFYHNPTVETFREYMVNNGVWKVVHKYPCINCSNSIVQIDENNKEHWACLRKAGKKLNDTEQETLYKQLKYVAHEFSDVEKEIFSRFATRPLSSCPGHSGHDNKEFKK